MKKRYPFPYARKSLEVTFGLDASIVYTTREHDRTLLGPPMTDLFVPFYVSSFLLLIATVTPLFEKKLNCTVHSELQLLFYATTVAKSLLTSKEMKRRLSGSEDEDGYDSSSLLCYWWRSAAKFDEYVKLKLDLANISTLTPRFRVFREMERLALIASEGLDEIRHKLVNYSSGDFWVPTGGIKREEMDIPPVITILLVGFHSSGKSSLVNLMYSVLSRSGLLLFAQTSSGSSSDSTTMYMEEHNVLRSARSGFCVYDSRGFDYERVSEGLAELSSWMSEGIHHNQLCLRSGDYLLMKNEVDVDFMRSSSKFVQRKVNCAMVVVDIAEIYKALKAADFKPLEATRELFCAPDLRKCNENPILVFTHGDKLTTDERMDARLRICEFLGASETNGVYDIVCLTEYGFPSEECDPVTAYSVTEAIYRALLISDRSHLPKKNLQDWALLTLSWVMCFFASFFAFLADICSKLGRRENKFKLYDRHSNRQL